jgi:glycosyltransferase involved in cell wall biosynthesis
MSKGTIVYVGGFELPDKNAAAHRVLGNAKAFKQLGYDVVFIDVDKSLDYNFPIENTSKVIQNFDCWSIPYPKTRKQWIKYLSDTKNVKNTINKYTNVQMVICYNYQALALFKLKRYCKKNSIKILADCTEWYSARGNGVVFGIIKGLDSFFRMRVLQKNMDGLIVISRYLEDYYKRCKNVICIPPLVDIKEKKWKRVKKLENDCLTLVYAGSPGKDKDRLDILIKAISSIKDKKVLLNIIGITKQQYLANYPKNKNMLEVLDSKINFFGRQDHIKTLDCVKAADFSIFFRDDNRVTRAGFPTKLVESISCGVPVITNVTSDIEEYLVDGRNGHLIDITQEFSDVLYKVICEASKQVNNVISDRFHFSCFLNVLDSLVIGVGK